MKKILLLAALLLLYVSLNAKVRIGSWNLQNFGDKKSDSAIALIANTLKDLDIVAIQEVLKSNGGARAVARLVTQLNNQGTQWDYVISNSTSGENVQEQERYAYIWKKARVKRKGRYRLADSFEGPISREPFLCTFSAGELEFTLASFHALPKKKQPETEIRYLRYFPGTYSDPNLIFLGDFNCPQSHTVFNPLKALGYKPALIGIKTTLRQECSGGDCMASEYDNIFYPQGKFRMLKSGVLPFYLYYNGDMKAARRLSDHAPVFIELE
jgi:deoxyribonuclease-1-like protein